MPPLKKNFGPSWHIPSEWRLAQPFQERVSIEGVAIYLIGLQAVHPQFGEVVGSAADTYAYPHSRAWFELLERMSLLESLTHEHLVQRCPHHDRILTSIARDQIFPGLRQANQDQPTSSQFQYAKSNGVALHTSWAEACQRACWELVERHVILSSWAGLLRPQRVEHDRTSQHWQKLHRFYDVFRLDFAPQTVTAYAEPIHVSSMILLPKQSQAPLCIGFGAAGSSASSMAKAEGEVWQRLGFLWGEELPQTAPQFEANHLYHQEYFLLPAHHSKIINWMTGKYEKPEVEEQGAKLTVEFVDLTFFSELEVRVVKAFSKQAIPLVFGKWREREFADLADERLIHPIA